MRIGIDLGGTNLRVGLVNDKGQVQEKREMATPANESPDHVVKAIAKLVKEIGKASRIGIGAPGLVNHSQGLIYSSPNLPKWKMVPLAEMVAEATGIATKVANDVNALTWGEFVFGAGKGCRDFLCITLGTGLGGGLILGGKLYTGKDHSAGEIGHMPLVRDGHPCPCGKHGCVEQYVAKSAIIRRAKQVNPALQRVTPETVAKAASAGETWAIDVYDDVAADLAMVLGGMIQVLNLEKIIVGGKIARAGEVLFAPLRRYTQGQVYPELRNSFLIEPSALGTEGGIIGAAFLDC